MIPCILVVLAICASTVSTSSSTVAQEVPTSRGQIKLSFAPVVKSAAPAVVNVYSSRVVAQRPASPFFDDPFFRQFFGNRGFGIPRRKVQNSLGSGVIVSADGFIVTNHHVIKGGTEIRVVLNDGREFEAETVLKDERTDLAILKIEARGGELPYLSFRNSDELEVGDLVLAIGNPFGVGQTVTSGIVSALARSRVGVSDFQSFIQTDAAINPGNSGGALIDVDGQLVGINTAIFSRSGGSNGIGFAVPSNMVRFVLDSARSGGRIRRPWFGASMQEMTQEIADSLGFDRPRGALLKAVHPQGPAFKAGLKRGDVIVALDGREIHHPQDFNFRFSTQKVGSSADVTILRGGKERNIKVRVRTAPEVPPRNLTRLRGRNPFSGATVANLSPAVAEELGFEFDESGVVILDPGRGRAARHGFRAGDIIVAVDGNPLDTVRELAKRLAAPQGVWTIAIRRGGRLIETQVRG